MLDIIYNILSIAYSVGGIICIIFLIKFNTKKKDDEIKENKIMIILMTILFFLLLMLKIFLNISNFSFGSLMVIGTFSVLIIIDTYFETKPLLDVLKKKNRNR